MFPKVEAVDDGTGRGSAHGSGLPIAARLARVSVWSPAQRDCQVFPRDAQPRQAGQSQGRAFPRGKGCGYRQHGEQGPRDMDCFLKPPAPYLYRRP